MSDMLIPPTEMHETLRSRPVGHCIYCGSEESLTDEHVIPYSLGGKLVLPDASCRNCAVITSDFERKVTRGFMLPARTTAGFPTRRPKERPTSFPLEVKGAEGYTTQEVSASEFPALLTLPVLAPPALFYPREYQPGLEIVGYETIAFGTLPDEVIRTQGGSGIRLTVEWDVQSYARLLAKIALGYAVATLGPIPQNEIPILPVIFGDFTHAGKWMGAAQFRLDVEDKRPTHALGVHVAVNQESAEHAIFVRLKMFSDSGATGNEIVVWTPSILPPYLVTA